MNVKLDTGQVIHIRYYLHIGTKLLNVVQAITIEPDKVKWEALDIEIHEKRDEGQWV